MHKDIANKWTAALRSGQYTQATEYLQKSSGFCCLGVLCDLHREQVGGEWAWGPGGGMSYQPGDSDDFDNSLLPVPVRDWAGLRGVNPEAGGVCLSALNDDGQTFAQLADFIDTYWEHL